MQNDDEQNIDDLYEEDFDDPDFIDDDEVLDFDDEEWDQIEEEDEEGQSNDTVQDLTPNKKFLGLSFEKMVIIGAILVGGIIMTTQVILPNMNAKNAQKKAMSSNTTAGLVMGGTTDSVIFNKDENLQEEDLTSGESAEEGDKGFLYEPEILDLSQSSIDTPLAGPSLDSTDSATDFDLSEDAIEDEFTFDLTQEKPKQEEVPSIEEPMNIIEESLTKVQTPTIASSIMDPDKTANDTKAPMQVLTEISSQSPIESSNISEKLDTILTRLEQMDQKIDDGLSDADDKIMALKGEMKKSPAKVASVSSKPTASNRTNSAPKKVSKPKVQPIRWELRSAQPGKAWVSKKGQSGVQAIAVGENLSGIGRITAITQVNGKWQVKGSRGTINQ